MGRWGDGEIFIKGNYPDIILAFNGGIFAYCLLPIAYCLLPIAYCLLPIAYCLLPIACSLFPVPCSLFPPFFTLYHLIYPKSTEF
ncbi:hypothetical protein [Moorena sp. SIO4G3]|uniref:hypothetical protein n=1 Tax=Moorena sp. SIO4G3 TaxID=2607821 RepID=UPI00142BAE8C|nr:hypothetical protein [Moorena sp. SIO4G3]NEO75663.1 hypothetical protein [Moorena sp. SIO4G3]